MVFPPPFPDNWFEDRVQEGLDVHQSKPVEKHELSLMFSASGSGVVNTALEHLKRHAWPDSRRTLSTLSDDDESRFTSTYKATSMETVRQKKKSLGKDSGRKLLVNRLVSDA